MSTISQRIDQLIKALGMNKNSFSKAIGLSNNSTITNIINNPGRTPSYHVIFKIADRFEHINMRWLISGQGNIFAEGEDAFSDINDRLAHIHRKEVISLSKAAKLLDVPETELKNYFYKNKPVSKKLIQKYIQIFPNINPKWIKHNARPMYLKGTGVSYIAHEDLMDVITRVGQIDESIKDLFDCTEAKPIHITRFQSILEHDIIMEVHTDAMQPEINQGDLLLCKKIQRDGFIPGSTYFIITGEYSVLRTIQSSSQPGNILLVTSSENTPPIEVPVQKIKNLFMVTSLVRRYS